VLAPAAFLLALPRLTTLQLAGDAVPRGALAAATDGARTLLAAIAACTPQIQTQTQAQDSGEVAPELALTTLHLTAGCDAGDGDVTALLSASPRLRRLSLRGAGAVTDAFLSAWAERAPACARAPAARAQLQSIGVCGKWPCVQALDVSSTAVTDIGVLRFLGGPAPLRLPVPALAAGLFGVVPGCAPLLPAAPGLTCNGLYSPLSVALEHFAAADCAVSDAVCRATAARCPRLVTLDVSRTLVTAEGVAAALGRPAAAGSPVCAGAPVLNALQRLTLAGVGGREAARLADEYKGVADIVVDDVNDPGM
jgi:hypothetical protein